MNLTFQQGTKLIVVDGADKYVYLVGDATASQTYIETSRSVKTLHNPIVVDDTFSTEKSNVSFSFSIHLGDSEVDAGILKWFGMLEVSNKFMLSTETALGQMPKSVDIYIDAGTTIYKISSCVGQNLSFSLARNTLLSLNITGIGVDLLEDTPPVGGVWHLQDSSKFYNAPVVVNNLPNLVAVTCELTRDIKWIKGQTTHNIGNIYLSNTPILDTMALAGSITVNKTGGSRTYTPDTSINIKYGTSFEINLDSCNLTERWDLGNIHKLIMDYKLLPKAANSYITF